MFVKLRAKTNLFRLGARDLNEPLGGADGVSTSSAEPTAAHVSSTIAGDL